jgi:hypothetical protein
LKNQLIVREHERMMQMLIGWRSSQCSLLQSVSRPPFIITDTKPFCIDAPKRCFLRTIR